MNTNHLNKYSVISGKFQKYYPDGIAYSDTEITEDLENVIIVFCYFGVMKNRLFDKVEFYEKLSSDEFNNLDKSPLVYILNTPKEKSQEVISDLKQGVAFTQ